SSAVDTRCAWCVWSITFESSRFKAREGTSPSPTMFALIVSRGDEPLPYHACVGRIGRGRAPPLPLLWCIGKAQGPPLPLSGLGNRVLRQAELDDHSGDIDVLCRQVPEGHQVFDSGDDRSVLC